jgi:flagellar hook protein FlgE
VSFSADFGQGPQTVSLKLGTFGGTDGVTQYAGNDYTLKGLTQNGIPPGSYSSLSMASSGDVVVNYDNGQSRTVARVPITTFADPDALQREDGQAFTATIGAGTGLTQDAGNNGAGDLVTSATESSNVDIAKEFTKLIVAQRAYSANTKLVTTADELLQQTIDMKR